MLESAFKKNFITELNVRLAPIDLEYIHTRSHNRSFPDLLILGPGSTWAALEFKAAEEADHQPNQAWYINRLNHWAYATFMYPENREEVLGDLEKLFTS